MCCCSAVRRFQVLGGFSSTLCKSFIQSINYTFPALWLGVSKGIVYFCPPSSKHSLQMAPHDVTCQAHSVPCLCSMLKYKHMVRYPVHCKPGLLKVQG